jgi:ParB family transcriptional regulator, chromosome partitioning protein
MSEELNPARKPPRKPLGRGLGSLLGEASAQNEARLPSQVAPPIVQPTANKAVIISKPMATPTSAPLTATAPTVTSQAVPAATPVNNENRVWQLSIEKVQPNRNQPRKIFAPEQLKELADSIKEKGIIQPILARPTGKPGEYEIIAGERRWRAAQQAGLKEVPVILRTTSAQETLELALIENIQRADLNVIEEAEAYAHLAKAYSLTQQEMAQKVGKDRATVANVMRLLQLAPEVRDMVKRNELALGQAKVLLAVSDLAQQVQVAKKVVRQGLTVRALEKLLAQMKDSSDGLEIVEENSERTRMIKQVEGELQKLLGTRVGIEEQGGKGRLSIYFYSMEELNQVIDRIRA